MEVLSIILIAFAMSTDAFAVSICKGVSMKNPTLYDAIKVGLLFGIIEAITPVLGWAIGYIAVDYIAQWDHWIILLIMLFLGSRMIRNGLKNEACCEHVEFVKKDSLFILILTAISTSIDAFAVGISLALANVNIIFAAILIGSVTCMMVILGIFLGKRIGGFIGKRAEIMGGIVLILIGVWTVINHVVV
ncbi:manganese efflux pump MntP family protein [Utexia brackfieldae]|uniref:manganese efflux pump MntP n=1 Tax=Utexia brackfieldae TaxID=3074108 RepID=UPI00370D31B9